VKLSNQLDDRTIEELQGQGAGPRTVEALRVLRDASAASPNRALRAQACLHSSARAGLDRTGAYAGRGKAVRAQLQRELPDFICTQVTRRYVDPTGLEFWRRQDVITERSELLRQTKTTKSFYITIRSWTYRMRSSAA
jgi:hypothetical protein